MRTPADHDQRAADADVRATLRSHTREVARRPKDAGAHLARLHAALRLPGEEPVQGVLADLFVGLSRDEPTVCDSALQMVGARLNPYVLQAFARAVRGPRVFRITPLATRWSVLAQPSAEVPTRRRRGNSDDSRRLAREVFEALYEGEPTEAARIEQRFLDHCISCHDKLAFMLAMRDLRRADIVVDERWERVSAWLAQHDSFGDAQPDATPGQGFLLMDMPR
ncbi:hypothetical protein LDO26_02400 [Luteimonas sp. BDR2-5]|uniref:hypothetical protein n=1 Tax=Proluteimonas luteida TaxID=2878685 RepID=UPI001E39258B|nr:hypothetical protein [Luteimonas sp. BDR2-5]MCD9027064.1 hypothetical protein [Luteimonas sp. BDR2-5]